jgi:hypothetical protein
MSKSDMKRRNALAGKPMDTDALTNEGKINMSDGHVNQHAERGQWFLSADARLGELNYTYRASVQPGSPDDIPVREVLPGEISITRKDLRAAVVRTQHQKYALSTDSDWSILERELFGTLPEGQEVSK